MMNRTSLLFATCFVLGLAACGPRSGADAGGGSGQHHHDPPHGGTGVELGDEDYHLEFVLDAAPGKMQAYILGAHMDNFVRVSAGSFIVSANLRDREETLAFNGVASNATGETIGDTALFEVQADWLKTNKNFDAVLKELTIQGSRYENVAFNFPKGN
jgi:hypothetical protein